MQFVRPFKEFDPKKGKLNKTIPPVIDFYLAKSREILASRTYEEIDFALATVNYLLEGGRELLSANQKKRNDEIEKNSEAIVDSSIFDEIHKAILAKSDSFTPASYLFSIYCSGEIAIENQSNFKDAGWAEYFAVLALASIGELVAASADALHPAEISSRSGEIAEAIAYANVLSNASSLDSTTAKAVLRLSAQQGGISTNQAFNDAKADYLDWFDDNYGLSVPSSEVNFTDAAEYFYSETLEPLIQQDYKHPLAAQKRTNAIRMLQTALRKKRADIGAG